MHYDILLTNLETVPGRRIARHLGLVQGSSVRAKHVPSPLRSVTAPQAVGD